MIAHMDFAVDINLLVAEAVAGSTSAFAKLVNLYQEKIRRYLSRFDPNASVIDDLAQEVFLTAFRKLREFEGKSSFSTWIHGIAKNKALTFLRSESRRKNREKEIALASVLEWQANLIERESDHEQFNFLKWLDECLDDLSTAGRQVIQLYYFEGKSSHEVGVELDKGAGAIRMMLIRIRRALLKCVTRKNNKISNQK